VNRFYSNGKLLLTGEYVVLNGALALALPTSYGQSLDIESIEDQKIIWQSFDEKGNIWFESEFILHRDEIKDQVQNDIPKSERLIQILNSAKQLNPKFLKTDIGFHIKTRLDFKKNWGLGTSSTLINNIANWANVDAYKLLKLTFGGSGYDIACAKHNTAITYQLKRPFDCAQCGNRIIKEVNFNPKFSDNLYFVYLNKKQNSREGIAHYKKNVLNVSEVISEINEITYKIIDSKSLNEFENLVNLHERIISKIIKLTPVKELFFKDFNGSIKSLGAWGGDFILVTSKDNPSNYFTTKGFDIVIPYKDIILNYKKSLTE
jgi:mevalonate kinase